MDFNFTEEQSMVRDTVASFLADKYDFETRRKIVSSDAGWRADLALLHADFANGYDAFAIDNSFTTRSDRPGRDSQRSDGASLDLAGSLAGGELRVARKQGELWADTVLPEAEATN